MRGEREETRMITREIARKILYTRQCIIGNRCKKMSTQVQSGKKPSSQDARERPMMVSPIILLNKKGGWKTFSATVTSETQENVAYFVLVHRHESGAIRFECSCEAGQHSLLCKHVMKVYNRLLLSNFKPNGVRRGVQE